MNTNDGAGTKKYTLVVLVEDKPGVLNRVSSLFRRRAFNIESIAVGHTESVGRSRMTIVVSGSEAMVEQVRKQLSKVIEVVKVTDITGESTIHRELALIRVKATVSNRSEIMQLIDVFRATIVDVAADSFMVEVTGDEAKIESLCNLLRGYGIEELARTGAIAMTRGASGPIQSQEVEKKRVLKAKDRKK